MPFEVLLTEDAYRDLEDIYSYDAEQDAPGTANDLTDRIEEVIESLSVHPERRSFPTQRTFRPRHSRLPPKVL